MISLFLIMMPPAPVKATSTFDIRSIAKPAAPVALSAKQKCARQAGEDIVVCGSTDNNDRYRLPRSRDRLDEDADYAEARTGGVPPMSGTAPCGIFAGQRKCRKAEAAKYGYGGGRDPVTVITKLAGKLVDADGD